MTRTHSVSRRSLLQVGAAAVPAAGLVLPATATPAVAAARPEHSDRSSRPERSIDRELARLERKHQARLGVFARNTRTGQTVKYRAKERFAMCSTFKTLVASAVLRDLDDGGAFLDRMLPYTEDDLMESGKITRAYLADGMTARAMCQAAMTYSDGTAANLLMREVGGPAAVTRFCRSIGDRWTRVDRWEPDLASGIPGDVRDTTTPAAFGRTLQRLLLGDVLERRDRQQLTAWMRSNTTSTNRLGVGLPDEWLLADKTGTGAGYGVANDVGIAWTTENTPVVLAIYTSKDTEDAERDEELIANASRALAKALAPGE